MWRVVSCLLLTVVLTCPAAAKPRGKQRAPAAAKQKPKKGDDKKGEDKLEPPADSAKRGCCAQHGGVCGCDKGAVKCCDGTASALCSCE